MATQEFKPVVQKWQSEFDELMYEGNAEKLVRLFYHPEAAYSGHDKCSYGTDELIAKWKEIVPYLAGKKCESRYEWIYPAEGGNRLFLKGTVAPTEDPSKATSFITELVKQNDGKYVVYRDYFDLTPATNSYKELQNLVKNWQDGFDEVMFEGDAEKLVTTFYHPKAAFVGQGQCSYGIEEITAKWKQLAPYAKGMRFETRHVLIGQTKDGNRLFVRGTVSPDEDSSKAIRFILELVKSSEGSYLIFRDYSDV